MSPDPFMKELIQRNKDIASTHEPIPLLSELGALGMPPPKTVVVTCMDPRCVPEKFLGLGAAEATIVRSAGGHIGNEAINSILVTDHFFGVERVLVVHHTDCGTLGFKNEEIRNELKAWVPPSTSHEFEQRDFGAITDLEQSVRDDLEVLKRSAIVRKGISERVYGFVFDIKTGLLTAVEG